MHMILWWYCGGKWLLLTLPSEFRIIYFKWNVDAWKIYIHLQRKMNRLKKMLMIISDGYSRNLTEVQNFCNKILVLCVVSVRSALTSCAWCSGASSSTSTPSGAPSPTWSGRPRTWGEWSTCADIDYLTCFFKEGYFLREKGEIRSAEIINCGGRKNGLSWHDLIVIFCDIN